MKDETKVRCSFFEGPRKPLSSPHGIDRIYCADNKRDKTSQRAARGKDVTDVDVSESGSLAIDFSSAGRDGSPIPLGMTAKPSYGKSQNPG